MHAPAPYVHLSIPFPILVFLAFVTLSWVVFVVLDGIGKSEPKWIDETQRSLGLSKLNSAFFVSGAILWMALFSLIFLSLWWFLIQVFLFDFSADGEPLREWHYHLSRIAAFVTVLGAITALPITLLRLQNASRSLGNTKINSALEGLSARREVLRAIPKKQVEHSTEYVTDWERDTNRHLAALDALFAIVEDYPTEGPRITRMLCHYVRTESRLMSDYNSVYQELSPAGKTRIFPRHVPPEVRCAMELLASIGHPNGLNRPDLTSQINLERSKLLNVQLPGAHFSGASFADSDLRFVNFTCASVVGTSFAGAYLQGAQLNGVMFHRNNFRLTEFFASKSHYAHLEEASFRDVEFDDINQISFAFPQIFGDGSVKFRSGISEENWPAHWPTEILSDTEFSAAYERWKRQRQNR
ncbi:pentapeptide repeat-containing protein [Ruegeria arenilitoris]|uniref:pentapeptide repeat-containing protein n=1 Tax=Ruegeria arenilitoris TaxID=1173585 RepID=UPI00147A9838|nr:pentapeptide repeat-containing protein [Ruegeria arenilitoris]